MRLTPLFLFMLLSPLFAGDLQPVRDQSILAAVTRKDGALKGLAHNHFIYAEDYQVTLQVEPDNMSGMIFKVSFPVASLVVDDFETASRWYARVAGLAGLEEPFEEQSDKNRNKVRKAMLGKKQLNAGQYPSIQARLIAVKPKQVSVGDRAYSHELRMEFQIHGTAVKVDCPANLSYEAGKFVLDAEAALRFTDFGMEPYSAMLGAVANQNDFFLFVHLVAQ